MIFYTEDGEMVEVYEDIPTKEKAVVLYYSGGYTDGSGTIKLTKVDLEKMLEELK